MRKRRAGVDVQSEVRPTSPKMINPAIGRVDDPNREADLSDRQHDACRNLGLGGNQYRENDEEPTDGR